MNQRNTGHVRWRRGLLEHYADGRLGWFDGIVFNILLAQVDFRSGAWFGNVWTVEPFLPRDIPRRNIQERLQDCFARLEKGGYVFKRAMQGKREYILWINKYETCDGKTVNGSASATCGKPVYFAPGEAPGDEPGDTPGDNPNEDRVNRAQVALNRSVAVSNNSNNSIPQELKKEERKSESLSHVDKDGSEQEPHKVLCLALAEAMGNPASLNVIQRKLEEKALALLSGPAGFTVDDLLPILRAALAGELDDKHWHWSSRIREADNPMAMFAAKIDRLISRYGALERRKEDATEIRSASPQKPGVAESMNFFNQAKKE